MKISALSSLLVAGLLVTNPQAGLADDKESKEYRKEQKEREKERAKAEKEWRKDHRETPHHKSAEYQEKYTPYRAYGGKDDGWDGTRHSNYNRDNQRGQSDWNRQQANRDRSDWNQEQARQNANRNQQPAQQRQNWQNRTGADADGFSRPLANTSKVRFDQLPPAVQRSIRQQAGGAQIEDIDRGTLDGRTVYEAAFKRNGVHNEVRVYEDGNVLRRVAGNNLQFPGAISLNQVPPAVQQTIRDRIGSAEINDIDRMNVNGRTVYEVGFKRADRVQQELQIAEDGTVVREPSGSNNP